VPDEPFRFWVHRGGTVGRIRAVRQSTGLRDAHRPSRG